ncbi:MAG: hypothetical protein ACK5WY_00465 [Holosporaceae bacterium]|jgi:hypothetical protein
MTGQQQEHTLLFKAGMFLRSNQEPLVAVECFVGGMLNAEAAPRYAAKLEQVTGLPFKAVPVFFNLNSRTSYTLETENPENIPEYVGYACIAEVEDAASVATNLTQTGYRLSR